MDALGLTAPEAARAFRLTTQTIRQWRLDPSSDGYRGPPKGWQGVLAQAGRDKLESLRDEGDKVRRVIDQLESES
jgi:hypothetical protein